ncbi:hypothetical protein Tco_0556771 [Tanacetum coccineum]
MKLAIERSKTQLYISQPSGSCAHEGTDVTPGVPDVPTYESDDEQISWKSSAEDDDDEENVSEHEDDDDDEQTEFDNNGDDFVHPKFSTHDDEAKQDEEVNEEDNFDPRVQTPSHVESTYDEDSDDVIQDANVEGDMINEEETHEEVKANVLYWDVNINLEGRDTVMTDAPLPNVQATQETEDTHVILTAPINPEGQQQSSSVSSGFVSNMLNPRPDTGIDSIFNINTEATSLVDVPVTTIAEPPLVFVTLYLNDKKYTASTTKSKASRYALLGISHWQTKHQNFYGYTTKMVSKHDVYSTKRILSVISVKVNEWYRYGHLEEIVVKRADQQLYAFKEGDFKRMHLNDIEDILLLIIKKKLNNLDGNVVVYLAASLHMFARRIVIQVRVEDLQLGVESYQKNLNLTKPRTRDVDMSRRPAYTTLSNPQGVIYEDKLK